MKWVSFRVASASDGICSTLSPSYYPGVQVKASYSRPAKTFIMCCTFALQDLAPCRHRLCWILGQVRVPQEPLRAACRMFGHSLSKKRLMFARYSRNSCCILNRDIQRSQSLSMCPLAPVCGKRGVLPESFPCFVAEKQKAVISFGWVKGFQPQKLRYLLHVAASLVYALGFALMPLGEVAFCRICEGSFTQSGFVIRIMHDLAECSACQTGTLLQRAKRHWLSRRNLCRQAFSQRTFAVIFAPTAYVVHDLILESRVPLLLPRTPQLFINYRMKSVAHLPWRRFIYSSFALHSNQAAAG